MSATQRTIWILVFALLGITPTVAQEFDPTFSYGTLSWKRLEHTNPSEIRVRLSFEVGLRRTFYAGQYPNLAVGNTIPGATPVHVLIVDVNGMTVLSRSPDLLVTSLSEVDDLLVGRQELDVLMAANRYPLEVAVSGARLSALVEGNKDTPASIAMVVDPSKGNRSPSVVRVPRIDVLQRQPSTFIVGSTIRGEGLRAPRVFAPALESNLVTPVPNGTSACLSGCAVPPPGQAGLQSMQLTADGVASWNPDLPGLYGVQFKVSAVNQAGLASNPTVLETAVRVVPDCNPALPGCSPRPAFSPTVPPEVQVKVGESLLLPISASTSAPGRGLTLSELLLPEGAVFTQTSLPTGANATGDVSWTPTRDDLGRQNACFRAVDSAGLANFGLYCLTLNVWRDLIVSFDSQGGTAVPTQSVATGSTAIEPTPPTRTGHTFAGWSRSPSPSQDLFDFNSPVNIDLTLYAVWTVNEYTVAFETNGGSLVPEQHVLYMGLATLPTPPTKSGYTFGGWYSDSGLNAAFSFTTTRVVANLTIYARWIPLTYVFSGFFSPVDNLPVLNVGQSGRTVPIKWRLARADGTPVTALSSFVSFADTPIACDASPADVLEEQLAASASGIRYDATADQFIYNWQTTKGVAGCRLVTVTLDEGSRYSAKFQLR